MKNRRIWEFLTFGALEAKQTKAKEEKGKFSQALCLQLNDIVV